MKLPVADAPQGLRPFGSFLAAGSLLCATAWLVSRVFVGLDFSDEMQYYGELASLARTGEFFQVDLFVQQVGYVFLFPFFKLHAILFPDQSYLVLFGRVLLLTGYGLVGLLLWRTAAKLGFASHARLAALAAFFAWVPFQIFSPSYNTISYLLVVAIVAVWLDRDSTPGRSAVAPIAALLVALTFIYPPAGLVLIAVAVAETGWHRGLRPALALVAAVVLGGVIVCGAILAIHGASFGRDVIDAIKFSRAFGVGSAVMEWNHLAALAAMLAMILLFLRRMHRGQALAYPLGSGVSSGIRWLALAVLIAGGSVLVALMAKWQTGYFAAAALQAVLMLLAVSYPGGPASRLRPASYDVAVMIWHAEGLAKAAADLSVMGRATAEAEGNSTRDRTRGTSSLHGATAPTRAIIIAALVIGSGALLAITGIWATGYFAPSVFTVLLLLVVTVGRTGDRRTAIVLAIGGAILGTIFSFSSGNGIHNFGVGVAGLIPFLVLLVARQIDASAFALKLPMAAHAVLPGLVMLVLLNAARNPFREERGWNGFKPISGVPAFKGIWTSPTKIEALERFQSLVETAGATEKRLLVAGPHPWLYFVAQGVPATPMFFMHFTWSEKVYDQVAERLFQGGPPDVIVVANGLPPPIHARIMAWGQPGCAVDNIALPADFTARYQQMTRYAIGTQVLVLSRAPAQR